EYVAPRNDTERQLCEIWQAVLGLEQVGINDNFFRIGGDSISAIRLNAKAREVANIDIPVVKLFSHPRIAELALELKAINYEKMMIHPLSPQFQESEYVREI
uniref:phosphopantetheine-binding protein n=1 Tax=uncultured Shewanella sp. TaxID=173975 RepID=UPI0026310E98